MKRGGILNIVFMLALLMSCAEEVHYSFEEQLTVDVALIDNYLDGEGINAIEDPSGVRYEVLLSMDGDTLGDRSRAYFEVTIWTLDGSFYGSNNPTIDLANGGDGEFHTISTYDSYGYGNYGSMQYFQFVTPGMKLGDVSRAYVPSGYGYGFETENLRRPLPPNTNLIVELKFDRIETFD